MCPHGNTAAPAPDGWRLSHAGWLHLHALHEHLAFLLALNAARSDVEADRLIALPRAALSDCLDRLARRGQQALDDVHAQAD